MTDDGALAPGEGELDAEWRRHGPWRETDPHVGTIAGDYVHGERQGPWTHFFADGRVRSKMTYERGELAGPTTWYRATGGLLQCGALLDGEEHGCWTRWDAAGRLLDEDEIDRGDKTGEWTQFAPDGSVRKVTRHRGRPGA